jgi:hypothetical protein
MLIATGELFNLIGRGTLSAGTSASSYYPLANLADGIVGKPFMFSTSTSDQYVSCDLNLVTNGGFETTGLSGWTQSLSSTGNTVTQTSGNPHAGTYSCVLSEAVASTSDYTRVYQDIRAQASERLNLTVALAGTVTSRLRIQLRELGWCLTTSGGWSSLDAFCAVNASTSYVVTDLAFVIPESSQLRRSVATLRIEPTLEGTASTGTVYVDDCYVWPSHNLVAVVGHDLQAVTPQWLVSATSAIGAATTMQVMTPAPRSFYSYDTTGSTDRYLHLLLNGVPPEAPWIGELVACWADEVSQPPRWGYEVQDDRYQLRPSAPDGSILTVIPVGGEGRRAVRFSWQLWSESDWAQFFLGLIRRSSYGRWPSLVVPFSSEETVMYCHLDAGGAKVRRDHFVYRDAGDVTLIEDAFPVIG